MSDQKKEFFDSLQNRLAAGKKIIHSSILGVAVDRFGKNYASIYAAGLAFYAIFSLFPLMLVLVSFGSIILERFLPEGEVLEFVIQAIPIYQDFIRNNLERVLELRGPIGIVGLISLVWSSTGYFYTLARGVNLAWPELQPRSIVDRRLVALGMVGGLATIMILAFIVTTMGDLLSHFQVPLGGSINLYGTFVWDLFSNYLPFFLTFLILWLFYFFTPNSSVRKRSAFWGAFPAAVAWNILNWVFTWYLRSGLVRYEFIYGSLGTIVSLLFWIYISNIIILLGAYISASVNDRLNLNKRGKSKKEEDGKQEISNSL
ncbi:MAG: YihY/virulence factor BrkB family protein [Anaerolineaceae bacterium]|nr:YihY/virulence factor BrkB family protein [Anaerolineaceae bacterium]